MSFVAVGTGTLHDEEGKSRPVSIMVQDGLLVMVSAGEIAARWPLDAIGKMNFTGGSERWVHPDAGASLELAGRLETMQLAAAMRLAGVAVAQ